MSEVSCAVRLPVAWITAETGLASLLPTVIATTDSCSLFAFALARSAFRLPPPERHEQPPQSIANAIKKAVRRVRAGRSKRNNIIEVRILDFIPPKLRGEPKQCKFL